MKIVSGTNQNIQHSSCNTQSSSDENINIYECSLKSTYTPIQISSDEDISDIS